METTQQKRTVIILSVAVVILIIAATLLTIFLIRSKAGSACTCNETEGDSRCAYCTASAVSDQGMPQTTHRADSSLGTKSSDTFLAQPDSIVYRSDAVYRFSKEEQKALSDAILQVSATYESAEVLRTESTADGWRKMFRTNGALEFRYNQKQISTNAPECWGKDAEYDAVWVFLEEDSLILVRVLNGQPQGSLCSLSASTNTESLKAILSYRQAVQQVFDKCDFRGPKWTLGN